MTVQKESESSSDLSPLELYIKNRKDLLTGRNRPRGRSAVTIPLWKIHEIFNETRLENDTRYMRKGEECESNEESPLELRVCACCFRPLD